MTTTMTTTSNGAKHGFLDLSPELRNEIYRLAFEDCTTFISSIPTDQGLITHVSSVNSSELLRTNKQIRSEAILLFYSTSRFAATSEEALVAWLKHLKPEQRLALSHVCMRHYGSRVERMCQRVAQGRRIRYEPDLVERLRDAGIAFDVSKITIEMWSLSRTEKIWSEW